MKFSTLLILLAVSTSSLAGTCELIFSSRESGKLQLMDGYKENYSRVALEECVGRAEAMVGSKVRMKGTMIRPAAVRKITEARYKYFNGRVYSSGKLYFRN